MTPTQKRVFTLLASAQEPMKVELSLIDDIKAEMAQANKSAIKGIDMIEAAKKPLENSLRDNENLLKKLQSTKKAAIELGAADILKEVQKFEIQVEENIKSIDKILNGL
tara:strand:- start:446 stop:772 length:327 start_codon:yes stop_codon:yes gene_type:complete